MQSKFYRAASGPRDCAGARRDPNDGLGGMFRQNMSGDEIIQLMVRLGLLAFLIYWSFVLVRPFIPILVWSTGGSPLYPPYSWLSMHLGDRPKLAARDIALLILAIIIGPVTWLGFGLADGLQDIAGQLGSGT